MAELRRPSRLALALVAILLPATMGWVCHGLLHTPAMPTASGIAIELPAAPSAATGATWLRGARAGDARSEGGDVHTSS